MSKINIKGNFFEKLNLFLSFYFNEEERADILNDYKEWFNNEISRGKSEEEIYLAFGAPQKIVKNIASESGSSSSRISIFLRNNMIQVFTFILVQWIMNLSFYRICNTNSLNFLYFALIINFVCFIMGAVIIKKPCNGKIYNYKWNLIISGLTLMIILFESLLLPRINYRYIGKICDFAVGILLLLLLVASMYVAIKKMFHSRQFAISTLLHISGTITLLFFLINQSHVLYCNASEFKTLLYGSIGIYMETIIFCFAYYMKGIYERK